MKRLLTIAIIIALVATQHFLKAQNFYISGGNTFSAVLCDNGQVFTWGNNGSGQLGIGSIGGFRTTPQFVDPVSAGMPEIQAVDAGSGSHVVALSCVNTVWTWGENCDGQLGNGLGGGEGAAPGSPCPSAKSKPNQVVTGEQNDPSGFLQNVKYVTSGTSQSYAIIGNSRQLVAWGSNKSGQLGANSTLQFSNKPVFVRKADGSILDNVIAVDAQDNACYALTADGQVWSWGENLNVALGCGATCTGNRNYAVQVLVDRDGDLVVDGPLNNVVMITAGDTHGLFQDNAGFLWSVGGDWGPGQRGNPINGFNSQPFATKVKAGEAKDSVNDDYLANVIALSAGQYHSMAVVRLHNKGYLMTWGGIDPQVALGTITTAPKEPRFVRDFYDPATNTTYKNLDVVGVSDGDFVTYAITLDPATKKRSVWVAGKNDFGQLGLGDQVNRSVLTKLDIPSCKVSDPCPVANLGPNKLNKCPDYRDELFAGSEASTYVYKWTKDGADVTAQASTSKGKAYLPINGFGQYIINITDNRSVNTCNPCPIARDTINILPIPTPFDTINGKFCGEALTFRIKNAPGKYAFFPTETGGVSLGNGTKVGTNATITVNKTAAQQIIKDSIYSLWVEDSTQIRGAILPTRPAGCIEALDQVEQASTQLTVFKDVTLNSVTTFLKSYSGVANITFDVKIYGTAFNTNGFPIADVNNVIKSFTTPPISVDDIAFKEYEIPINFLMTGSTRGSTYWINAKVVGGANQMTLRNCVATLPYVDNIDGNTVHLTAQVQGTSNPESPQKVGSFYNYKLSKPTDYKCGRIQVSVFKQCPACNKPKSVTITTPKPYTSCDGGLATTLKGIYADSLGSDVSDSSMTYVWYKKKTVIGAPTDFKLSAFTATTFDKIVPPTTPTFAASDSGTWVLRVQHGKNPLVSGCYREDSIKIKITPPPPALKAIDTSFCQGATGADFKFPLADSLLTWYDEAGTTKIVKPTIVTAAIGTFTYQVSQRTSKALGGCEGPKQTIKATVTPEPTKANAGRDTIICGNSLELKGNAPAVGTGTWSTTTAGVTFAPASANLPNTVANNLQKGTVITFRWTVGKLNCTSNFDEVVVTVSGDLSDPKPTVNDTTICVNGSVNLKGTLPATANQETGYWAVSPITDVTLDTTGHNITAPTAKFTKAGVYTFTYTIDNPTCNPAAKTIKIIVMDSAKAEILTPLNVVNPNSASTTFRDPTLDVTSTAPAVEYVGAWSATSPGSVTPTNALAAKVGGLQYNESSTVSWSVQDKYQACPAAIAKLELTRKDYTKADAEPDKAVCMLPATNLAVSGNNYSVGIETASWTVKSGPVGTAIIPLNGDTTKATFTPGTLGVYEFYYTIVNKLLKITTKDSVTVRVDSVSALPQLSVTGNYTAANPYFICAEDYSLPGIANNQTPLSKNWWVNNSGPGTIVPQPDSTASPNLKVSADNQVISLTYWYKNGVCPAESKDFFVQKVGKITAARVSITGDLYSPGTSISTTKLADTLCVNMPNAYTLNADSLPKIDELGSWKVLSGTSVSITALDSNKTSNKLTVNSPGTTSLIWQIKSTIITTCFPNELKFDLVVQEPPSVDLVTGATTVPCEDDVVNIYSANMTYTSSLSNAKLSWDVTSGSAVVTDNGGTAVLSNFKSSLTTGASDTAIVIAKATNACGSNSKPLKIGFRLKPRDLYKVAITDTINGPTIVCETGGAPYRFDNAQPNTDSLKWTWTTDGSIITKLVYTSANNPLDTAWYYNDVAWGNIDVETMGTVKVQLGNVCGYGKDTSTKVNVIPAVDYDFDLVSDKIQNSFCIPLDQVGIWAEQSGKPGYADSLKYGNLAHYTFMDVNNNVLQGPQAPDLFSRVFYADKKFTSDTVIYVTGQPFGCLNSYATVTKSIKLFGYDKPVDVLVVDNDTVCDDNDVSVTISLSPISKDVGNYTWYKVDKLGDTLSVGNNNIPSYSPSGAQSSGIYFAMIQNKLKQIDPTSNCPDATTNKVPVKIYDTPDPVFPTEPLLIFYNLGQDPPSVRMPLITSGTEDSLIYIHYDPPVWLDSTNIVRPLITTTQQEAIIEYVLELKTGDRYRQCPRLAVYKVINTVPLRIPNAFSPNDDGVNEKWVIDGMLRYPDSKIKVFNRWGNAMFTDNYGYKTPWDGTHNGAPLASGTYYYVIELKGSPDGTDGTQVGSLTIVR